MRRTLLATGFAVLVSMLLAPHGDKNAIEGWGLFFSNYGVYMHTDWGDVRTAQFGYGASIAVIVVAAIIFWQEKGSTTRARMGKRRSQSEG